MPKGSLDEFRRTLGNRTVDAMIDRFGLDQKADEDKKHTCPECGRGNAYYKEIHPDTDIHDVVLFCPDCKFLDE